MKPKVLFQKNTNETYFKEGCFVTESLNHADDPALSIAHIRVAAGQTTRWHHLLDTTERYYILAGSGRVELAGIEPALVGPGDVVIIPPGCAQRITNTGQGDLLFLAMCTPRFREAAYCDTDMSAQ